VGKKDWGEFLSERKAGGLNVEGIVLRVTFLKGLDKRSVLMMDFHGGIWKNAHLV